MFDPRWETTRAIAATMFAFATSAIETMTTPRSGWAEDASTGREARRHARSRPSVRFVSCRLAIYGATRTGRLTRAVATFDICASRD